MNDMSPSIATITAAEKVAAPSVDIKPGTAVTTIAVTTAEGKIHVSKANPRRSPIEHTPFDPEKFKKTADAAAKQKTDMLFQDLKNILGNSKLLQNASTEDGMKALKASLKPIIDECLRHPLHNDASLVIEPVFSLIASHPQAKNLLNAFGRANILLIYTELGGKNQEPKKAEEARTAITQALASSPETKAWVKPLQAQTSDITSRIADTGGTQRKPARCKESERGAAFRHACLARTTSLRVELR